MNEMQQVILANILLILVAVGFYSFTVYKVKVQWMKVVGMVVFGGSAVSLTAYLLVTMINLAG